MYVCMYRISFHAYAIKQQWWQYVPKNEMSLISFMSTIKNNSRSLAMRVTMWFCQKIVDTPVNGRLSLFGIDSVHQIETSLSHALLV
jgi:hypothetical protein